MQSVGPSWVSDFNNHVIAEVFNRVRHTVGGAAAMDALLDLEDAWRDEARAIKSCTMGVPYFTRHKMKFEGGQEQLRRSTPMAPNGVDRAGRAVYPPPLGDWADSVPYAVGAMMNSEQLRPLLKRTYVETARGAGGGMPQRVLRGPKRTRDVSSSASSLSSAEDDIIASSERSEEEAEEDPLPQTHPVEGRAQQSRGGPKRLPHQYDGTDHPPGPPDFETNGLDYHSFNKVAGGSTVARIPKLQPGDKYSLVTGHGVLRLGDGMGEYYFAASRVRFQLPE